VRAVGDAGKICVLEIDVQGVKSIRNTDLSSHYFFFYPPSHDSLRERLTGRASETEETMKKRLNNALAELDYMKKSDFSDLNLVNDDLQSAYKQLRTKVLELYPHLKHVKSAGKL
jgi:guanylate kinase